MTKNMKVGVALVAAATLISGGAVATSASATTYKYYIAYQGPLTGDNKQTGLDEIAGVKYALALYNKANPKAQVGLKQVDDQGSGPGASVVAPGTAKDKSILAIVGPAFSGASVASFPYYKAAGLPLVSPSATRVTLTDPTSTDFGGPVFHRLPSKDDKQGPALAKYAIQGVKSPVVYTVNDQSSYGTGLDGYVQAALKTLGHAAVGTDSAEPWFQRALRIEIVNGSKCF